MKQESAMSAATTAPGASRFGSNASHPSAMNPAPVPSISRAARKTTQSSHTRPNQHHLRIVLERAVLASRKAWRLEEGAPEGWQQLLFLTASNGF
jgi:hypothetical protein